MDMGRKCTTACLLLVFLAVEACLGQNATAAAGADIWRQIPSNAIVAAVYDGSPENPTVRVLEKAQKRELRDKQEAAFRKAVESFATLFGVSLDFTRDIEPWMGDQWAFVLLPGEKEDAVPVPIFLVTSRDPATADAALEKLLAPWQRMGELRIDSTAGCSVRAFRAQKEGMELYASACGQIVALATSQAALNMALTSPKITEESPLTGVIRPLQNSIFYVFADPAGLQAVAKKQSPIPVTALGMGVSAVENGYKLQILGTPSEQLLPFLNQILPSTQQIGVIANAGIPSPSLIVVTLPDLRSAAALVTAFAGGNPQLELFMLIGDTLISGALTSVLPYPSGVISAAAESETAASEKVNKIKAALQRLKLKTGTAPDIGGVKVNTVQLSKDVTVLWAQVEKYLLAATDAVSLSRAIMSVRNEAPSILENTAYKETITGLSEANLQTAYINTAPVQGIGHLMEGVGVTEWVPVYRLIAEGLKGVQGLGIGVGFDGRNVSGTLFLRAEPGTLPAISPTAALTSAVGAMVMVPVIIRAQEQKKRAECIRNMEELAAAMKKYASDHKERLPSRLTWTSDIEPYLDRPLSDLRCSLRAGQPTVFAFNKNLGGLYLDRILNPAEVVMFFEASPELPNRTGSRADVAVRPGGMLFAYADGHVEFRQDVPEQYHWVPKYKGSSK